MSTSPHPPAAAPETSSVESAVPQPESELRYRGPENRAPEVRVFRTGEGAPRVVRRFRGGPNRTATWDGRVSAGPERTVPAPEGDYAFTVAVRDKAGNLTEAPQPVPRASVARPHTGVSVRDFIDRIHETQARTLARYDISLDAYSGTSQPDCFPIHSAVAHDFLSRMAKNGLLQKRTSRQWYDPKAQRFLPDRFVRGRCPNPKCDNENAYSDECDRCGHQHDPSALINPRSAVSDATPEMRSFATKYKARWGNDPNGFEVFGYDVANLAFAAVQKAGSVDHQAVIDALRAGAPGVLIPEYKFNQDGDLIGPPEFIYTVENGAFKLLETVQG